MAFAHYLYQTLVLASQAVDGTLDGALFVLVKYLPPKYLFQSKLAKIV